jgi:hypothetical protein
MARIYTPTDSAISHPCRGYSIPLQWSFAGGGVCVRMAIGPRKPGVKQSLPSSPPTEDLDLAIPDMDNEDAVRRATGVLNGLPGIVAMRMVERGAFIRYNPVGIKKEEICQAFQQAGFRASVFQDSKSGKTGKSSQ